MERPGSHRTGAGGKKLEDRARAQDQALRIRSWAAVDAVIARGAARYRRERDLPRLLPRYFADAAIAGATSDAIVDQIKQALLRERTLGQRGHRAYNLTRHMALAQALKAEREAKTEAPPEGGAQASKA